MSERHPTIVSQYGSQKGGVYGVRFRPNMKHLVSGGGDNIVYLWSMHCRPNLRHPNVRPYRYVGHQGPVYAVAVSPSDNLVASGSKDKSIRFWIPTVEGKSTAIKGHTGPVRSVNFSQDGQWIISGSDDKTMKIWQVSNHKFICALSGHMNWVRSAEFSYGIARQVVSGSDDRTVRLWDIESHQCINQFPDVLGEVYSARFHPDNNCIASGSSDQCIQIWDIRSKSLIQHYAANAGAVHSVCFHPAGNYLLSSCGDATLKIWDLREGQILYTLQGHEGGTRSAEFSPTGEFFASGSADEHVVLWRTIVDLGSGKSADLRGVVRKDEVGHALCSACNCVCTSVVQEISCNDGGSSVPADANGGKRPPSPYRMMRHRPPTPPKKHNADSTDNSEEEGNLVDGRPENITLFFNTETFPHLNWLIGRLLMNDLNPFENRPIFARIRAVLLKKGNDLVMRHEGVDINSDIKTYRKEISVNIHESHPKIEVPKCRAFETLNLRPASPFEEETGTAVSYENAGLCGGCKDQTPRDLRDHSPRGLRPGPKDVAPAADMNEIATTVRQLCNELSVLTRTVSVFEERLSHSENKMLRMERHFRDDTSSTTASLDAGHRGKHKHHRSS